MDLYHPSGSRLRRLFPHVMSLLGSFTYLNYALYPVLLAPSYSNWGNYLFGALILYLVLFWVGTPKEKPSKYIMYCSLLAWFFGLWIVSFFLVQTQGVGVRYQSYYGYSSGSPLESSVLHYATSSHALHARNTAYIFNQSETNASFVLVGLDSQAAYDLGFSPAPSDETLSILCGDLESWVLYDYENLEVKRIATRQELVNQIRETYNLDPYTRVTFVHQSGIEFDVNGTKQFVFIFPENGEFVFK